MKYKDTILVEVCRLMIPIIQLFSIYIIFHGHLSPGGGFAGGAILGCSFIIMHLVFGKTYTRNLINKNVIMKGMSIPLVLYGLLKGYSFLSYDLHLPKIPSGTPGNIFSAGLILPLNIIVGIVVSLMMYFVFSLFLDGEV
ncbi:multisubunit sodium/proton antiporter, MrpB subunit [Dethiosulfatibacter aminovorans DSM 17477]|uniref:Multisubunit sodium/proton antiporter, MrpB subunit n=1 Tax=Dethiosulfatibacter aminovorans DSM 17477 TaxID=1121476 RepID=A0A1M6FU21_9FIRM|nr:MnhB domain-containing protein [Dethiosulfatibacter aminovorans]SHJ01202.1 multisubunit sodium/proton antiporter, MrpB subunit [Dethiosulfatibacter aminovorans DSM 17477]